MFDHLQTPENALQFLQMITDRDGQELDSFVVGEGYGVFRALTADEMRAYAGNNYSSIGIVVAYERNTVSEKKLIDGAIVSRSHTIPSIGDVCLWRGRRYDISGVQECLDIDGILQGYKVFVKNGQ